MQYVVFLTLAFAVIAVYGQRAGKRDTLICLDKAEDQCLANSTCKFTCKYHCCNTKNNRRISVIGSVTYLVNSSVCRSALHDLRFPPGDLNEKKREVVIRRFYKEDCFLEGSVRYGFSSLNFHAKSCEVFEFVESRISEDILDIVSMHSNYMYGENENHTQICVTTLDDPSQRFRFGIYSKWLDCENAIKGERIRDRKLIHYKKVWNDTESVGFQCFSNLTVLSVITSIAFSVNAHFLPKILTITVNKYEEVILTMDEQVLKEDKDTVWKKDGKELFKKPNDSIERTQLSLMNVHEGSSGIYSLSYNDADTEKAGFVQLIVRTCPKNRYGDNCSEICQPCLNGGICHDITGECVCAPGFNGFTCQNACEPGYLGKMCNIKCVGDSANETELCRGLLICLPSPYGCSCASGFGGLNCDEECPDHLYGAGCLLEHEYVHVKNGSCSRFHNYCDCLDGWHGDFCNESYPVLRNPPSLINTTESSIALSFSKWSNISDIGSGKPAFYEVAYKEFGDVEWKSGLNISAERVNETYQVLLPSLKPATEYLIGILVIDESGNKQEKNIQALTASTLCSAPSAPPSNITLSPDDNNQYIYVHWNLPLKEEWNCWEIKPFVKVRDSITNVSKECIRRGNSTCFFMSEPFVMWIVEVCASSDENKVKCSKPYNVTIQEKIYSSLFDLEIIKSQTSLTLSWMQPRFINQLRHYVITHIDMDTNKSISTLIKPQDAFCGSDKDNFHCYTINDLIPGHWYSIKIEAFYANLKEGHLIKSVVEKLEKPTVAASLVLGVCLPLVLILCIIGLLLYKRRRKRRKSTLRVKFIPSKIVESEFAACNEALDEIDIIETESVADEITNPVKLEDLPEYVKQGIQNTKIRKEFISVPTGQIYPCNVAKLGENKAKNRYGNILPYDHSRVSLDVDGELSNYIHASYIHGYNKVKKYIATQGPLQNTVKDFWQMIWDEDCCKILMITNVMENGKCKCEKYWTEDSCKYGDINISFEDSKSYADFIIRTFEVSKDDESREVKQFHFTSWPDHGAPSNPTPFVNYLKKTRCYKPDSGAPIIVHCSAGIGRTGASILLDSMIDMALEEKQVDLVNHLCSMRKQRMNIVENFDQYVFVYCALVETLCFEDVCIKPSDFKKEFERLETTDKDTGMKLIDKQFQALCQLTAELMYKDVQEAYQQENQSKNRSMMILPPDRARPVLSGDFSSYINAVYVDNFTTKNAYIATQYPLPETIQDFWNMVYEQKSKIVILLQEIDCSKEEIPQLWLPEGVLSCGDFDITWQSDASENSMTVANIIISHKDGGTREPLSVNIVTLERWASDSDLPTEASVILSAIHKVNSLNFESPSVITIVCIDGVKACGVFCTCLYICDHYKAEDEINIFHAAKCVRTNRPQFILNLAQYEFIFEVISSYLDSCKG